MNVSFLVVGLIVLLAATAFADLPPFSRYEVIEKRNFFRPKTETTAGTENPAPVAAAAKQADASAPTLTGVVRIRGVWKAILEKSSGTSFYVGAGDDADGWIVKEIRKDGITLQKHGKEVNVVLRERPAAGKKPAAGGTAPRTTDTNDGSEPDEPEMLTGSERQRLLRTGRRPNNENQ